MVVWWWTDAADERVYCFARSEKCKTEAERLTATRDVWVGKNRSGRVGCEGVALIRGERPGGVVDALDAAAPVVWAPLPFALLAGVVGVAGLAGELGAQRVRFPWRPWHRNTKEQGPRPPPLTPPGGGPGWPQFSQESHHTQPTGPWAPRRVRDYEVAALTPPGRRHANHGAWPSPLLGLLLFGSQCGLAPHCASSAPGSGLRLDGLAPFCWDGSTRCCESCQEPHASRRAQHDRASRDTGDDDFNGDVGVWSGGCWGPSSGPAPWIRRRCLASSASAGLLTADALSF